MTGIDNHLYNTLPTNILKHHSIALNSPHNFPIIVTDTSIRNSLIHFLLGFNTTHIYDDVHEGFIINPNYKNHNLIYPFYSIVVSYKKIVRFILKMNYGCSNIKSLLTNFLITRVDIYHNSIVNLLNAEIEEIYIKIHSFVIEFKEYASLIELIDNIEGLAIFNVIVCRVERGLLYYEELVEVIKDVIYEDVVRWCRSGEMSDNLFITMNVGVLQFDESFYKNTYEMCDNVPKFLDYEKMKIYECGLMKNTMQCLNKDMYDETLNTNNNIDEIYNIVKASYYTNIVLEIKEAIKEVYTNYFVKDNTWIHDLLNAVGNKVFNNFDTAISDVNNTIKKYKFKSAESRINHYVLKILNIEKYTKSAHQNIFENLLITTNNKVFDVFFSHKIKFELDIIFRFLYQLSVFEYYFSRVHKNNFVIKVRLFLEYYRSALYLNYIDGFESVLENSDSNIVGEFEEFIKYMLKQFYFTQMPIFTVLSEIFDVLFEYVYVKGDDGVYLCALNECLLKMKNELQKTGATPEFLFYLEILK